MVVAKSIAPSRLSALPGALEVVEHLEVLEQRLFGVDREREDVAAAGRDRDLALFVRQRRAVEELGDALAALDLGEQHLAAAGGQRERERGGHRRLAGAALAGDHVQAHAVPVGVSRAHPCEAIVRSRRRVRSAGK